MTVRRRVSKKGSKKRVSKKVSKKRVSKKGSKKRMNGGVDEMISNSDNNITSDMLINDMIKEINKKNVYMFIGHGSGNRFNPFIINDLNLKLDEIINEIPNESIILYFGDGGFDKENADIGYVFKYLHMNNKKKFKFLMIQTSSAKGWGIPKYKNEKSVEITLPDKIYWHDVDKNDNNAVFGGIKEGKPLSNTKMWVDLHKKCKCITKIYVFGGGPITNDEMKIATNNNIVYYYYPIIRKYNGDKKTLINIKISGDDTELYGILGNKEDNNLVKINFDNI